MNKHMHKNLYQEEWNLDELAMKHPLFRTCYDYLLQKYSKFELTVSEMLSEIQMSNSDFYEKKRKGVGIPSYRQKDEKSRIYFPIICVAIFLSQDFVKVD